MAEKVVIIGSGPAGWTAAIYAARANLSPLIYEGAVNAENGANGTLPLGQLNLTTEVGDFPGWPSGKTGGFLRNALPEEIQPYWVLEDKPQPTNGLNGPELMELMRQQARNFGARIVTDDIARVDFKKHPFRLTARSGIEIEALAVIVATGRSAAIAMGVPGEERFRNWGIFTCAVDDGTLPRLRNRPMVVVGEDDAAFQDAVFLTRFASRVYLVCRDPSLKRRWLSVREIESVLASPKIEVRLGWAVRELFGTEAEGLTSVRLRGPAGEEQVIECPGLFHGMDFSRPNTEIFRGQLDLDDRGLIRYRRPDRTETSVDGVFAAGDVADDHYRLAITAARTGCMAALDAER